MGIPKIKTATTLRGDLYDTLKEVSEGSTQIITHKQGEPVLLVSKVNYDKLLEEKETLKKMAIGLSEIESGEGHSHKDALKKMKAMKKKWK
jgi:hypothetical protein